MQFHLLLTSVLHKAWDRIPVGTRFFMPFRTGPEGHPSFRTVDTVKWPGRSADHLPNSSTEVEKALKLYVCLPSVPAQTRYGANFTFWYTKVSGQLQAEATLLPGTG